MTEIPIPTKIPQEIRTKNAHNNLPDYHLNTALQRKLLRTSFFSPQPVVAAYSPRQSHESNVPTCDPIQCLHENDMDTGPWNLVKRKKKRNGIGTNDENRSAH